MINKAYLLFLKYVLNFFNAFNALFQSRQILIHKLFKNSQQLIAQIADNFITFEAIEQISLLNPDSDKQLKALHEIYLGPECEAFLLNEPQERTTEIRQNCLEFYKTAVREMMKRLPYKDIFFEQLSFLDPKVAFSCKARATFKDLHVVATRLGLDNIDVTRLAFEWRILPRGFSEEQKELLISLDIDEMWAKILECEDDDGNKSFSNLAKLVEAVLSLPHSNAEAERIFSIVADAKSKKRNKLGNDTLSAICVIKSSFQAVNINYVNFEIDSRHLELHNSANLYNASKRHDDH